jgi:hypothetical protein
MAQGRDTITQRVALEGAEDVKKQLDDIGRDGEKAFRQLENASRTSHGSLSAFTDRVHGLLGGFRSFGSGLEPIREGFSRIGEATHHFTESLRQTTETVFPHFAEIVPAGVAAVTAGFLELAKHSAEAVRETQNLAAALGLTVDDFEGLELVAARAGVSNDAMAVGMSRFAQAVGHAREEQVKLTGQLDRGVSVVRGNAAAHDQASTVIRGGVHTANQALFDQTTVLRGNQRATFDFSDAIRSLGINLGDFRDNSEGNIKLLQEAARRLDILGDSTIKARIAQQLFGREWRNIVPAFANLTPALNKALVDIREFGTGIEQEEKRQANAFLASYQTMRSVVVRVGEIFGNIFGQALVPIFDGITVLLTSNLAGWKEWADGIVHELVPRVAAVVADLSAFLRGELSRDQLSTDFAKNLIGAFQTIRDAALIAFGVIRGGFELLARVIDPVAALINTVFGTSFTGETLAAAAAILYFTGAFNMLSAAIGVVVAAIGAFGALPVLIAASLAIIIAYFYAHWDEVKVGWNSVVGGLSEIFTAYVQKTRDNLAAFVQFFVDGFSSIGNLFQTYVIDPIVHGFDVAIYWANYFIGLVEKGLSAVGSLIGGAGSAAAAPAPAFASGGDVRGPKGTDRVPIWATAGEFVQRVAAVQYYGLNFMRRLNNLEIPRFNFGGLVPAFAGPTQHFALGGVVRDFGRSLDYHTSEGGHVVIDLSHNGNTFGGLLAPRGVAEALGRYADTLRVRRSGKMPGFRGS